MPRLSRAGLLGGVLVLSCVGQDRGAKASQGIAMHQHTVTALGVSEAHHLAATGDMKGRVLLWSTDPVTLMAELVPPAPVVRSRVRSLAFSPEGRLAIATDWTGTVELWDGTTYQDSLQAFTGQATTVAWTHDGRLVTGGGDAAPATAQGDDFFDDRATPQQWSVKVWDHGKTVLSLSAGDGMVRALAVAEGDGWLAASAGETVTVWRLPAGDVVARFSGVGEITAVSFQAQGLVVVGAKGSVVAPSGSFQPGAVRGDVRGPAAAGLGPVVLAAGDYQAVHFFLLPGLVPAGQIAGRAYAAVGTTDGVWIATADELLRVDTKGRLAGRRSLRAP